MPRARCIPTAAMAPPARTGLAVVLEPASEPAPTGAGSGAGPRTVS
jgi:hypothetical protein